MFSPFFLSLSSFFSPVAAGINDVGVHERSNVAAGDFEQDLNFVVVQTNEVEINERSYIVADSNVELDLDDDIKIDQKTDSVEVIFQHTTTSLEGQNTTNVYFIGESPEDGEKKERKVKVEDQPAPGYENRSGKSLLGLVKRAVQDEEGETTFVPVFVYDLQIPRPYFDPVKGPKIKLVDRDFELEAMFVKGDWEAFEKGKKVRFKLTEKGMKRLRETIVLGATEQVDASIRGRWASVKGNTCSEIQLEEFRFDIDPKNSDEGTFFEGNREKLEASYAPFEVTLSFEVKSSSKKNE